MADSVKRAEDLGPYLKAGSWICGSGCRVLADALESDSLRRNLVEISEEDSIPSALVLGDLAHEGLSRSSFDRESIHTLQPAYLRPSEPEIVWARRQRENREAQGGQEN